MKRFTKKSNIKLKQNKFFGTLEQFENFFVYKFDKRNYINSKAYECIILNPIEALNKISCIS